MRTLRRSSSFTLCISRSMAPDGLPTNSIAPSSSARSVLAAPSLESELTMTMGRGFVVMISAVAWRPSTRGILMSMVMTSGLSDSAIETASRPSLALPTTCICPSALKIVSSTLRMKAESSTTRIRIFLLVVAIVRLRHRSDRARSPRSHELFDRGDQLIFLHGLGQKCRCAFLESPVAVLCSRAGRHNHHRDPARRGALPQLHHQFIARHARHLEIGDDKMAAVLRHQFRRLQPIGRQLHAVAILLEHSADEFAHADGVVRNDDDALLLDAVDGLGRNSLTRRRYSPRFLMTISSLPRTSSTTRPICRLPAFATTMRKYPMIGSRGGKPR